MLRKHKGYNRLRIRALIIGLSLMMSLKTPRSTITLHPGIRDGEDYERAFGVQIKKRMILIIPVLNIDFTRQKIPYQVQHLRQPKKHLRSIQ